VRVAREKGVITALDNTWGAGVAFDPFDLTRSKAAAGATVTDDAIEAVDISMHALTKYPSGGGDVLMGSVTTIDSDLHLCLKATHMRLGFGVGANDVELVLRSLPSMPLRYAAHDAAARSLAQWLSTRPEVARVLHPALAGSPGHEHWAQLCSAAAGLFSIEFDTRYSTAQVDAFVDALRIFKIGFSWGGPMSLAVPYSTAAMRSWPAYAGAVVRLSIGLEDVVDLRADLESAFEALVGG
jgi:cystathionine beta-lyase